MAEVEIRGRKVTIERFTLAKAMRAYTLLHLIQKDVPEISKAMAEFRREYRQDNAIALDRVQAKMRYGPQPVVGEDGEPLYKDGELVTLPSPIDRMSEVDWEHAGQVLTLPQSPSNTEMAVALFPMVYEKAEQPIMRLLGLVTMSNDDVDRYVASGEIWDRVDDQVKDVIGKAYIEEIMELVVSVGEVLEGSVLAKAQALGERAGKFLRRIGWGSEPTRTPESSPQQTSTTSNEPAEQPSTESASPSPETSTGQTPSESDDSPGTPSSPSGSRPTVAAS